MELLKIALLGYGKMGKTIENLAQKQGFTISEIFDEFNPIQENQNYNFDIAIDFSVPTAVLKNIQTVASYQKNIVIGTTGWQNQKAQIFEIVKKHNLGLVYSSNFSIGMLIFKKLIRNVAMLLNNFEGFDIAILETHHTKKLDAPSGTALTLANEIIKHYSKKSEITSSAEAIANNKLLLTSLRLGEVFGEHRILIDSDSDHIELIHQAKNRNGFALGALFSAQWIHNKHGIYEFEEIFE